MLNLELYEKIKEEVKKDITNHNGQQWYNYSYNLFIAHKLESIGDFWKMVAFSYSWMPTIPTIHYEKIQGKEPQLLEELKKLQQGNGNMDWLFNTLTPVINNSVVGTSKTLHFIAPDIIPIYDSRVIKAWNTLFKDDSELTLKSKKGDINKVLFFVEKMHEWKTTIATENDKITLRDIELALYYYGKL
jgi:hypothetical protein